MVKLYFHLFSQFLFNFKRRYQCLLSKNWHQLQLVVARIVNNITNRSLWKLYSRRWRVNIFIKFIVTWNLPWESQTAWIKTLSWDPKIFLTQRQVWFKNFVFQCISRNSRVTHLSFFFFCILFVFGFLQFLQVRKIHHKFLHA